MSRRSPARLLLSILATALAASQAAAFEGPRVRLEPAPDACADCVRLTVETGPPAWREGPGGVYPELPGFGPLGRFGEPELPARLERVALEPDGGLAVRDLAIDWSEGLLPGPLAAHPALAPDAVRATAREGWWPAEPVLLESTRGMLRDLRFATLALRPVQVDTAAGRFRVARRITVTLERTGGRSARSLAAADDARGPFDRIGVATVRGSAAVGRALRDPRPSGTLRPASADAPTAGEEAWQLLVDRDGLYRLGYEWAQANAPGLFSFLTANDPRQYRLASQGAEVPIRVTGEADGVFGPGDALVFYGEQIDEDLFDPDSWQHGDFTDTNVYRLTIDPAPARVGTLNAPPTHASVPPSFRELARHEENDKFTAMVPTTGGVDHWYADPFLIDTSTDNVDQVVATPGHVGGNIDVTVRLLGFEGYLHQTEVRVDGSLEDTADWDDRREFTHEMTVDRTASPLGPTTLVNIAVTGARGYDAVAINWVEVAYDRAYDAVDGRLDFDVAAQDAQVRLGGFAGTPEVWEITDVATSPAGMPLAQPVRVTGLELREGRHAFDADDEGATRRFVAADPAGFLELATDDVREDLPPADVGTCASGSLRGSDCGADWVVLGPAYLLEGPRLDELVAHRQGQGLATAVVAVQDVYDEFSHGIDDPEGIRRFFAHALGDGGWDPAPTHLVLVGDATYDYKNDYGHAFDRDILSTYTYDFPESPKYQLYPSDIWYGAVLGDDDLPDLFVGRVPAHDLAEAEVVFGKILDYEAAGTDNAWNRKAILVSENGERADDALGGRFLETHDRIYDKWFAGGPASAQKVYEEEPWLVGCDVAAENQNLDIDAAINEPKPDEGAAMLSFVGHGNFTDWGLGCPMFSTEPPDEDLDDSLNDIDPGTPLQFHVHANCITGNFATTKAPGANNDTWYAFMEDWLVTADKGAIGGIAPAHLSYSYLLGTILDPVYGSIYGKDKERIAGAVDLRMRTHLLNENHLVPARSMILFGDPATRIAVPLPGTPEILSVSEDGSRALLVDWTSVPDAAEYRLFRSQSPSGPYDIVTTTTATSHRDTGLANCVTYYYYVLALDDHGFESRRSNTNESCGDPQGDPADCRSGTPENPDPPTAPTLLDVADLETGGRLQVTWERVPDDDVVEYHVRYRAEDSGTWQVRTVGAKSDTVVISGLRNKVLYHVAVRAAHCSRESADSNELTGTPHLVRGIDPPGAIGDLMVQMVPDAGNGPVDGADDAELTWGAPAETVWGLEPEIAGYEVYGSSEGPAFRADSSTLLASLGANAARWVHELAPASPPDWYYLVVALDAEGLRSAAGSAVPDAVSDLRIERLDAETLRLRWSTVRTTMDDGSGRPVHRIAVRGYNLYGRGSNLPRGACSDANRLAFFGQNGASSEQVGDTPLPEADYFTYQLLTEDHHGTEAVW